MGIPLHAITDIVIYIIASGAFVFAVATAFIGMNFIVTTFIPGAGRVVDIILGVTMIASSLVIVRCIKFVIENYTS